MPAFTSLLRSLGFILLGTAFFAVPRSFAVTVTAPVGGKITFNVSNSGTAPFTYQWRKDGANIAGATASSLALTRVLIRWWWPTPPAPRFPTTAR